MTNQTYQPVEPHWPLGRVAQFYLKKLKDGSNIGIRELVVSSASRTENGWRVTAELPDHMFARDDLAFEFEVDEDGESTDCVPWDDELDREYNPLRSSWDTYTEPPSTRPIQVGEPAGEIRNEDIERLLEDTKHVPAKEARS